MVAYHRQVAKHRIARRALRAVGALWACDSTRMTSPVPSRDAKWEVDSKAEVNGS